MNSAVCITPLIKTMLQFQNLDNPYTRKSGTLLFSLGTSLAFFSIIEILCTSRKDGSTISIYLKMEKCILVFTHFINFYLRNIGLRFYTIKMQRI